MKNSLVSIFAAMALAGCGNPLDRLDTLADVDLSESEQRRDLLGVAASDAAAPDEGAEGFLAKIVNRVRPGSVDEPADLSAETEAAQPVSSPDDAAPRWALLSRLRGKVEVAETATAEDVTQDEVQLAALGPENDDAAPLQAIRGLFGPRGQTAPGIEDDITPGQTVPFGTVARACGTAKPDMGQRIEMGSHGFALYDSQPGSTAPRNFFITGFSDGCPRQFTAALAIFGAPAMHEKLRYGRPSEKYPYSDTDKAYEQVKSKICGASRRQPCGASISKLERNTVFISTYERFTDNGRWADILVHDGALLAASLKDL